MRVINVYKIVIFFIYVYLICAEMSGINFGKFKLQLISLDKCKGPKRLDCCSVDWRIGHGNVIYFSMNASQNIEPLRAKIIVSTNRNNLIRLQVNKVCDNVFMKPFMQTILNFTDDCVILKGSYKFVIDTESVISRYYGGEFFYGNVSIYSVLNNNRCNFSCSTMRVHLSPRK